MRGPLVDDSSVDITVLVKAFRRMQRRFERLATRLEDAREVADAAAKDMEDLVDGLSDVSEVTPRGRALCSPEEQEMMRAEAEAGAPSLQIVIDADGTGKVRVSGRRWFALPPQLATLLAILAAPGGETHNGRPGWRTTSEVAEQLNKRTGGAVAPRSVAKILYKLRRAFRDARENWRLVQKNRKWGVRFAVQGIAGDLG